LNMWKSLVIRKDLSQNLLLCGGVKLILRELFGIAGPCVVNVYINYEKKFAFVEFRTGEPSVLNG
jgi:hypothetical protein